MSNIEDFFLTRDKSIITSHSTEELEFVLDQKAQELRKLEFDVKIRRSEVVALQDAIAKYNPSPS